jgi:cathepsin L
MLPLALGVLAAATFTLYTDASPRSDLIWRVWKRDHSMSYPHAAEEERRREIFAANVEYINKHNARGDSSVILGTNRFSDRTRAEFASHYLGRLGRSEHPRLRNPHPQRLSPVQVTPKAVDWVQRNGTTPVKNQGPCGGCW